MSDGPALVRVLVCDDQTIVREGLTTLLDLCDEATVVGAATDGADALELLARIETDVVLMDLKMPVMDGVEATREIARHHPGVAVLVLTSYAEDEQVFAALQAGAQGFLTKDATAEEIRYALVVVAGGGAALDHAVQARLLAALRSGARLGVEPLPVVTGGGLGAPLTHRETEIVAQVVAGLSNAEIATALVVSESTVKSHINHIFAKTGVRDRAQLVTYAYRRADRPPAR